MVVVSTRELSFARRGDYDTLKAFFVDDLKLSGTWEQPGGDKKVFKLNNSSIVWRKAKNSCKSREKRWVM